MIVASVAQHVSAVHILTISYFYYLLEMHP